MDQCTHEVRAEYWRNIIKACGQRPAGQSAKKWMDENGICEQSYYHCSGNSGGRPMTR